MPFDAHANFAYSTVAVAPVPAASGTSLEVAAGTGALFPAVPFNAVCWPLGALPLSSNAEVLRVTARAGDVLTVTRTQESSSARTIGVGDQIAEAITAKVLTDVEAAVTALQGTTSATPPGSPVDGDIWRLPADAASGVYWLFRYDAASASAFKWTFLGGAPLSSDVATQEATASGVYVDLATVGPSVTLPRAGDYDLLFGASMTDSANAARVALASVKLGAAATADSDSTVFAHGAQGAGVSAVASVNRGLRVTGMAASDVVKLQYRIAGGSVGFEKRWLKVTPVRVS